MTDNLEEKALALIKSKPRGILQSELWKELEIDSRKCSRVVAKLEAEGKIKRTWETVSGTRTYRLSYIETKKEAPKKEYRFDLIMAEDEVAPCVGCTYECEPDYCPDLGVWIELLAREEARKPAPAKVVEAPPVEEAAEAKAPPARPSKAAGSAGKGKATHGPGEEVEEPVKPARKGRKAAGPEAPVKMAKTAARKGIAVPEPEEEEESGEEKPALKGKAASKAAAALETKKAPAKKRK